MLFAIFTKLSRILEDTYGAPDGRQRTLDRMPQRRHPHPSRWDTQKVLGTHTILTDRLHALSQRTATPWPVLYPSAMSTVCHVHGRRRDGILIPVYSCTLTMKISGVAGGPEPASVLALPPNTCQLPLLPATSDVSVLRIALYCGWKF